MLDLSEAISHDLGGSTGWYSDKRLRKELADRHAVGYQVKDRGNHINHLALVPLPEGRTARRILRPDVSGYYG